MWYLVYKANHNRTMIKTKRISNCSKRLPIKKEELLTIPSLFKTLLTKLVFVRHRSAARTIYARVSNHPRTYELFADLSSDQHRSLASGLNSFPAPALEIEEVIVDRAVSIIAAECRTPEYQNLRDILDSISSSTSIACRSSKPISYLNFLSKRGRWKIRDLDRRARELTLRQQVQIVRPQERQKQTARTLLELRAMIRTSESFARALGLIGESIAYNPPILFWGHSISAVAFLGARVLLEETQVNPTDLIIAREALKAAGIYTRFDKQHKKYSFLAYDATFRIAESTGFVLSKDFQIDGKNSEGTYFRETHEMLILSEECLPSDLPLGVVVQHEIEHHAEALFELRGNATVSEIRSFLAEIAFSDPEAAFRDLRKYLKAKPSSTIHQRAAKTIVQKILNLLQPDQLANPIHLRNVAQRLLDEEYIFATGQLLTQSELFEPFQNSEGMQKS